MNAFQAVVSSWVPIQTYPSSPRIKRASTHLASLCASTAIAKMTKAEAEVEVVEVIASSLIVTMLS
jgi:hypothetical protein